MRFVWHPDLTAAVFKSVRKSLRARLMKGQIRRGEDIIALRTFAGLTQEAFAAALGISVHTLRNWEQDRRKPEGPALALLRVVARHPQVLREGIAASDRGSARRPS
jgi:DNA-binding transcriptional regulator YiaG